MTAVGILLEPVDLLFFRGSRVSDTPLPHPQTVAGAIRRALLLAAGFDLSRVGPALRDGRDKSPGDALRAAGAPPAATDALLAGPLFCRNQDAGRGAELLFAAPRTLYCKGKGATDRGLIRGFPVSPESFVARHTGLPDGLRPIWIDGAADLEPAQGYLTTAGMKQFLDGGTPEADQLLQARELYDHDSRVGIGIDSLRNTAVQGLLYNERLLTLRAGVALYVEYVGDEALARKLDGAVVRLGGQSRCAELRVGPPLLSPLRQVLGGPCVLVTVTPGELQGGALPALDLVRALAASVGRPVLHSGWDLAQGGPRRTRALAPAGSVYFVDAAPRVPSLCSDVVAASQGEGAWLSGRWRQN